MLRNFLKTATRNIAKYRVYSIINFIGLSCGLGLTLLILVYVRSETGYDRFHTHADRLYRLSYATPNGLLLASTPPPIAPRLTEFFPDIEDAARLYLRGVSVTLPDNPQAFEETNILFADSTIFKMFSFDFVQGTPKKPLVDKFTVIINEEMASKYFGQSNPMGESIILSGRKAFKVVGVVKDFPEQSHIHFNMLIPYDNMFDLETDETARRLRDNLSRNFIISHSYTYVRLKPGADPKRIDDEMDSFLRKYAPPRSLVGQAFTLMPVTDIHLGSDLRAEPSTTNSRSTLFVFIGVGLLTLIIACINYVNLSTAQSFTRVKEIGIRKVMGSMRHHLILQFFAESLLFCLISMMAAYLILYLSLPLLNQVTQKHLVFWEIVDSGLLLGSMVLLGCVTILAGGYPAYFITQFESIRSLKGVGTSGNNDQFMRKAMVVVQLTIACVLLSGSLLIIRQLRYLEDRPLGFQKEQVMNVHLYSQNFNSIFSAPDSTYYTRLETFRRHVESQPGVISTALSSGAPGLGVTFRAVIPEGSSAHDNLFAATMSVDHDFLDSFEMDLIAGRSFDRDHKTDETSAYIVNETAVTEFGWGTPDTAVGKLIEKEGKKGVVIGVVKDFNFASLRSPMSALVVELNPDLYNTLSVEFGNGSVDQVLDGIGADWLRIFPEKAFEYSFLDEQLEVQYSSDQNFGIIIQAFTVIAILICCLGVYGLVLFTVQRKVKEIGVRKVLGADVVGILGLICRDFALLIIVAFVTAVPVSYLLMRQWLTNFVYHTDISWITYASSLLLVTTIVALTVSYQAIRAAQANPVASIRSE